MKHIDNPQHLQEAAFYSRKDFLIRAGMLAASLTLGSGQSLKAKNANRDLTFFLLGDLHFDKLSHHDLEFVKAKYDKDLVQIENYSRITALYLTGLLEKVVAKSATERAAFIFQLGDFLEGLCGSEQLAHLQATEFIALVDSLGLTVPLYVTKGNHDITGPGANEVYKDVVLPWQAGMYGIPSVASNHSFVSHDTRFIVYDSYKGKTSLEWLKKELENEKERRLVIFTHMPVIPISARANWVLFAKESEASERSELLDLLSQHKAIVFCAHLHKHAVLKWEGANGAITQVCIGSVMEPNLYNNHIVAKGVDSYAESLLHLEPSFNPQSKELRAAMIEQHRPSIRFFELGDLCGYGRVLIKRDGSIRYDFYQNLSDKPTHSYRLDTL